jgi:dTDP-4-amino-4,6-dideoxygalactose transaminase
MTDSLAGLPGLRIPTVPDSVHHAYYKYYAFVRPEMLQDGWDRDAIMRAIKAEGVPCFVGSCSEIYLEKAFVTRRKHPTLPVARLLGETSLMFLVHPTLSDEHIALTCQTIEDVITKAVKRNTVSARSRAAAPTTHT